MSEDELIQKQIEEGNTPHGIDADAYRVVFRALKKEPGISLPDNFAQRVASLAFAPKKSFNWDKFFLISGIVSLIIALTYAIAVTEFKFSFGEFKFLSTYPVLFVFGTLFIIALHLLDKRFIHPTSSDHP